MNQGIQQSDLKTWLQQIELELVGPKFKWFCKFLAS
jgi:hypothetical protein